MTFDTYELPNRAVELWNTGVFHFMGGHGGPAPHIPSQDEVLNVYNDWVYIPNPDDFGPITDMLETAMEKLTGTGFSYDDANPHHGNFAPANGDLQEVVGVGSELNARWTGTAASTFQTSYAVKFAPMAQSQFQICWILREAINAEAAVWQSVRDTLDKLSKDAISQAKQIGHCSQSDFKMTLEILGAVVAVAAAVPTGGASVAAAGAAEGLDALEVVGAGIEVASTGMDVLSEGGHDTDEMGLGHGSCIEVFHELKRALTTLKGHIGDQESPILTHMGQLHTAIGKHWHEILLPRPPLAKATKKNVRSEHEMGHAD